MGAGGFRRGGAATQTLVDHRDAAIRQYRDGRKVARAVAALHAAGVLAPFEANEDVETVDPARHFYVKTDALAKVDDATFIELRRAGALPIAFGQAHSLVNMRKVRRMRQRWQRQAQARRGGRAARAVEAVDPLDDDEIVLDFGSGGGTWSVHLGQPGAGGAALIPSGGAIAVAD